MSRHDDDLSAYRDEPVVRALTGPATPQELAGEGEALAAFQAAVPVRSRRRLVGRLGVGGSTLGIAIALSGGVAAAYTSSLPTPVQQFAHDITTWLGPVKVPDAPNNKPKISSTGRPAPVSTTSPTPAQSPLATSPAGRPQHHKPATPRKHKHASHPGKHPHSSSTPTTSPKPVATPTPSTTPTPTASPTPTQTPTPQPGSITISLSDTTVAPGGSVTAYGQLSTSTGNPVSGEAVWLLEHQPGQAGVSQVDSGTTGSDGSVTLQSPALSHSVRLRLVTGSKARSAWIAVIVQPTVSASVSTDGTTSTIRISTDGADPGDTVDVQRRVPGGWQDVAANQLDSSGAATFGVPTPTRRPDHYRAILPRTPDHGYASTRFLVPSQ